jgi:exosortase
MSHIQSKTKQKIKAIILVGNRDFGRCPLASQLLTALWPIAGKTALEHLLAHLAQQGIKQAVICSSADDSSLADSITANYHLELNFLHEPLPVGTAGCIRDASGDEKDELLLVLPASLINPPEIETLIRAHNEGGTELTVFLNPSSTGIADKGQASGIYICSPSIVEHIPKGGYFDIKEGLIPEILRAGKTIHAVTLPKNSGNFRNRQEYLYAIANYIEETSELQSDFEPVKGTDSHIIWMGTKTKVDPTARIYGPVITMNSTRILKGAVIVGPTILGNNVTIGKDSIVVNSILWDGVQLGTNCHVQQSVIDYNTIVRKNTVIQAKCILFKPKTFLELSLNRASKIAKDSTHKLRHTLQPKLNKISTKIPVWAKPDKGKILRLLAPSLLLIAFLWSYWPGLTDLWKIWLRSDEYSSGLLVPFLAVYILWSRRQTITQCRIKPSIIGVFILLAAATLRLFGLLFMYGSAERLSIALSIAALVMLLYGWQLFKKIATILLFLCLMLPWPNRIQAAVSLPLQRWSTSSAVFCLELIGYEIMQEGNIIHIGDSTVAVAEACNGLRMITAFFVISGLVALLIKRAWWEKLIILVSSLPIALLCNTVRLAITAVFFTVLEGEYWEKMFHDFGGYAMMPLALAVVVAELWLLAKLTIPPETQKEIIITRKNP